jgi:DNA protecting protein DprA
MTEISSCTQLALLLTARWIKTGADALAPEEFHRLFSPDGLNPDLATELLRRPQRFADLSGFAKLSKRSAPNETLSRLGQLIERGLGVMSAVERWRRLGLWVLSVGDPEYPQRLKNLESAPPVIFGFGDPRICDSRSLAVVGSRKANEEALALARDVGKSCAIQGVTLLSGGALGVDTAAMVVAASSGGTVLGVLCESVLRRTRERLYRQAASEGRLCLLSEVFPEARFQVGNAMARNRLIYGCADAALVVACTPNKGGTWAGASQALRKGKSVFVYSRAQAAAELAELGAQLVDAEGARQLPEKLCSPEGFRQLHLNRERIEPSAVEPCTSLVEPRDAAPEESREKGRSKARRKKKVEGSQAPLFDDSALDSEESNPNIST